MDYSLAVVVLNKLISLGKRRSVFGFDGTFTEEELLSIDSLTVTNCDSLNGISLLKNLKKLSIVGSKLDSFEDIGSINRIVNFEEINKLSTLEQLVIMNDYNIQILDISTLENLRVLKLFNAPNLMYIRGLDSKKNLESVMMCNCQLKSIGDVKSYVENTIDAEENILDLKSTVFLLKDSKTRELLKDRYNSNLSNIRFGEHIYFYDQFYTIDIYQAIDMYHRASKILDYLKLEGLSDEQKVFEIYKYVVTSLEYDHEGLKYRDENYMKSLDLNDKEKRYILRRMAVINSSFGAFTKRKVVCDGYVNMMKYLLAREGISSQSVLCKNKDGSTHAAIKYMIDGIWCYADPEKDNKNIRFFNMTKEEFSKLYILSYKEEYETPQKEEINGKYFN